MLQTFSGFQFAGDAQPETGKPPSSWAGAEGPKGRDRSVLCCLKTLSLTYSRRKDMAQIPFNDVL